MSCSNSFSFPSNVLRASTSKMSSTWFLALLFWLLLLSKLVKERVLLLPFLSFELPSVCSVCTWLLSWLCLPLPALPKLRSEFPFAFLLPMSLSFPNPPTRILNEALSTWVNYAYITLLIHFPINKLSSCYSQSRVCRIGIFTNPESMSNLKLVMATKSELNFSGRGMEERVERMPHRLGYFLRDTRILGVKKKMWLAPVNEHG